MARSCHLACAKRPIAHFSLGTERISFAMRNYCSNNNYSVRSCKRKSLCKSMLHVVVNSFHDIIHKCLTPAAIICFSIIIIISTKLIVNYALINKIKKVMRTKQTIVYPNEREKKNKIETKTYVGVCVSVDFLLFLLLIC